LKNSTKQEVIENLLKHFDLFKPENLTKKKHGFSFSCNYSLFRFKYQLDIYVEKKDNFTIHYEVQLFELLKITIFILIFAAFFTTFSFHNFFIFILIITFVFVTANIVFITGTIKRLIHKLIPDDEFENSNYIAEYDILYENDIPKCPKCKTIVGKYHTECPGCATKLSGKPFDKEDNMDITKYKKEYIKEIVNYEL